MQKAMKNNPRASLRIIISEVFQQEANMVSRSLIRLIFIQCAELELLHYHIRMQS